MINKLSATLLYDFYCLSLDTGLLIQERKRPRKLSHKVLECTIEEVSVAPTKKKVCWTEIAVGKSAIQL